MICMRAAPLKQYDLKRKWEEHYSFINGNIIHKDNLRRRLPRLTEDLFKPVVKIVYFANYSGDPLKVDMEAVGFPHGHATISTGTPPHHGNSKGRFQERHQPGLPREHRDRVDLLHTDSQMISEPLHEERSRAPRESSNFLLNNQMSLAGTVHLHH